MPRIVNTAGQSDAAVFPSAYRLDEITLTNHSGRSYDIQHLVTSFEITESIYLPSVVLSLSVKDSLNLVEELELSGQEKIRIKVSKKKYSSSDDFTDEQSVTKDFYVTEYPTYGKTDKKVQAYILRGISEHAYLSKFKRISRAFTGNIKDFVVQVLTRDLGYDRAKIKISERDTANVAFIVPNLAPLDAIAWALRRAYDGKGSPWYCYESLYDGIHLEPQGEMVQKDSYFEYREQYSLTNKIATAEDYDQRRAKILSMASDLRMSKYIAGANGAFSATTEYVDIAKKSRSRSRFSYGDEYYKMEWSEPDGINLSDTFTLAGQNLDAYPEAKLNYVPINSESTSPGNYHAPTLGGKINLANSYVNNLDNISHDIKVAGDFDLNAGNSIDLKVSKSIDPGVALDGAQKTATNDSIDTAVSGKYLVCSVIHKFGKEYESEVRIKRDSTGNKEWFD